MTDVRECADSSTSLWQATCEVPTYAPLSQEIEAEVCIVGAGIAGLTAALLLARAGRQVVVLDSGQPGRGNTARTTAHLSNELDDRYSELVRIRGLPTARLAWQSHTAAIDRIEAIARDEAIGCDFLRVDGYLFTSPDQSDEILREELAAVQALGWREVQMLGSAPGLDGGSCLRFPGQAQFHPLKYVAGLCAAIVRHGGVIHGQTRVLDVAGGEPVTIATAPGPRVRAGTALVTTCSPICDLFAIHTKQAAYTTYVIGLKMAAGEAPRALLWDTQDPYHYVRSYRDGDHDVLIVGGEDHKTGQADDGACRFDTLEAWARARFPGALEVLYRWSGVVFETLDGLAHIGPDPAGAANVHVATGDSGMGMTHGTIAGTGLANRLLGQPDAWADIYEPRRKPLRAANEYLRENLNVATQYAEWLLPGELGSVGQLPCGHGAVIRSGLSRVAVYRDEAGELHACSAACTHLLGSVSWNDVEKTWDCPCHGSRFDRLGEVISGPARTGLHKLDPRSLG